jgi:hypothetical protein
MIGKYIVVACAALVCEPNVVASPTDIPGCHWKIIDTAVDIKLSGREVVGFLKMPAELGRFEIENHRATAIVLHGTQYNGKFYIEQPYIYVQALTTDMSWHVEGAIPASFETPADTLNVQANSKASFLAYIHFPKLLNSTDLLRLVIQDGDSKSCFLSDPFQENEAKSPSSMTKG